MSTKPPPVVPTPRKSWRRWYLLGGFVMLAVALPLGLYVFSQWSQERELQEIYRQIEEDDPHWRWHDLFAEMQAQPPLADEENAVAQVAKVYERMRKPLFNPGPKWDNAWKTREQYPNARLNVEQADALRAAFSKLAPTTLAEARELRDMPQGRSLMEAFENPLDLDWSKVQQSRSVMYLLQHDAILRADDRDLDGAADSCRALAMASHALREDPFFSPQLVRLAAQRITIGAVERTLGQGEVSGQKLAELQAALQSEASDSVWHRTLRGERAYQHRIYLLMRQGKISYSNFFRGGRTPPGGKFEAYLLDGFPSVLLKGYPDYLRYFNVLIAASKTSDAAREAALAEMEQNQITQPSLWSGLLMGGISKISQAFQFNQSYLRCALVAVAAERYRVANGRWPRVLDEVVKEGLLSEIPMDTFDGQPLRYRRTATGVVVYTVGRDKIDNGGKLDRTNPFAPGTDVGVELWEPALRHASAPVEEP